MKTIKARFLSVCMVLLMLCSVLVTGTAPLSSQAAEFDGNGDLTAQGYTKVYMPVAVAEGADSSAYASYNVQGETIYAYPSSAEPVATSEYMTNKDTKSPYIYTYVNEDGMGKTEYDSTEGAFKLTNVKGSAPQPLDSMFHNYVQIMKTRPEDGEIAKKGGIIEIKFSVKMQDLEESRVAFLGLPTWRQRGGSDEPLKNAYNHFFMMANNITYFAGDGCSYSDHNNGRDKKNYSEMNDGNSPVKGGIV